MKIEELTACIHDVLFEKIVEDHDDRCPKCKSIVHANDVGHSYYYICPKCGYSWHLTEHVRRLFGEPLI